MSRGDPGTTSHRERPLGPHLVRTRGRPARYSSGSSGTPGVSATFFKALADAGVNVEMISTSEIRISVVTRSDAAQQAVQALHTAFGLDADGEAVVYAGTGR